MANKYNQRKVVGMLRKLAKGENAEVALEACRLLLQLEGMAEGLILYPVRETVNKQVRTYKNISPDVEPISTDEPAPEPTITAAMLSGYLEGG